MHSVYGDWSETLKCQDLCGSRINYKEKSVSWVLEMQGCLRLSVLSVPNILFITGWRSVCWMCHASKQNWFSADVTLLHVKSSISVCCSTARQIQSRPQSLLDLLKLGMSVSLGLVPDMQEIVQHFPPDDFHLWGRRWFFQCHIVHSPPFDKWR